MIAANKTYKISSQSQTLEKQDEEIDIDLNIYKVSKNAIINQVLAEYVDTTRTESTYLSLRQNDNVDLTRSNLNWDILGLVLPSQNGFDDYSMNLEIKPLRDNLSHFKLLPDLTFESEGYKVTRDRLISLLHEDDEEEPKPTYAFDLAWKFMTNAAKKLPKDLPRASVAADDEGGIRIRWRNLDKSREVSLYCPSSNKEKAYIYYEIDDKYDVDYNSPDLTLAEWLTWLTQEQIG